MKFQARLVELGRVKGVAILDAPNLPAAEREANEGVNVIEGQWVELQAVDEDALDKDTGPAQKERT